MNEHPAPSPLRQLALDYATGRLDRNGYVQARRALLDSLDAAPVLGTEWPPRTLVAERPAAPAIPETTPRRPWLPLLASALVLAVLVAAALWWFSALPPQSPVSQSGSRPRIDAAVPPVAPSPGKTEGPGDRNDLLPTAIGEPAGAAEQPLDRTDQPAGDSDQPAGNSDQPGGGPNQFAGEPEHPAQDDQGPGASDEPPGGTKQPPDRTGQPAGNSDQPGGGTEQPPGGAEPPAGGSAPPPSQQGEPVAVPPGDDPGDQGSAQGSARRGPGAALAPG